MLACCNGQQPNSIVIHIQWPPPNLWKMFNNKHVVKDRDFFHCLCLTAWIIFLPYFWITLREKNTSIFNTIFFDNFHMNHARNHSIFCLVLFHSDHVWYLEIKTENEYLFFPYSFSSLDNLSEDENIIKNYSIENEIFT